MNYCTTSDLTLVFGSSNVNKWADLENNGLQSEIDDRIAWAIEQASSEIDARLAPSRYQFPLAADSTLPPILKRACAYCAGVLLYESRGITDAADNDGKHALLYHRKKFEEFISDVLGRRLELLDITLSDDAVVPIDTGPAHVTFEDPSPSTTIYSQPQYDSTVYNIATDPG